MAQNKNKKAKELMTWKTSMKKFLKQLESFRPILQGLIRGGTEFVVEGTDNSIDNAVVAGLDDLFDELPSISDILIPFVDSVTESGQMQVLNTIKALWDQSGISGQISNKAFNKTVLSTFKDRMENILRTNSNFFDKLYSYSHKFPKFIEKADQTVKDVANKIIEGGQEFMNNIKNNIPGKGKGDKPKTDKNSGGGGGRSRNHPDWYMKFRDAANLLATLNMYPAKSSFTSKYSPEILQSLVTEEVTAFNDKIKTDIPSVMGIEVMSNGWLSDYIEGKAYIKNSFDKLWASVRRSNSGAINSNIDQYVQYISNYNNIVACLEFLTHLYALATHYSVVDRGIPYHFFNIANVSYDDFSSNLANINNMLVLWKNQLSTYKPFKLSLFERTQWMFSNVFKDSNDTKSNYYIFTPRLLKMNVEGETKTVEEITFLAIANENAVDKIQDYTNFGLTWYQIKSRVESIISEFATMENSIISGDIMKAFGLDTFNITPQKPDAKPSFTYDEYLLQQIENSKACHFRITAAGLVPYTTYQGYATPGYTVIDSYKDKLNSGELLSITRLSAPQLNDNLDYQKYAKTDWIVTRYKLIANIAFASATDLSTYKFSWYDGLEGVIDLTTGMFEGFYITALPLLVSRFNYHPALFYRIKTQLGPTTYFQQDYASYELNNFMVYDAENYDVYNQVANMSLLFTSDRIRLVTGISIY